MSHRVYRGGCCHLQHELKCQRAEDKETDCSRLSCSRHWVVCPDRPTSPLSTVLHGVCIQTAGDILGQLMAEERWASDAGCCRCIASSISSPTRPPLPPVARRTPSANSAASAGGSGHRVMVAAVVDRRRQPEFGRRRRWRLRCQAAFKLMRGREGQQRSVAATMGGQPLALSEAMKTHFILR